jgi:dihydrofolate reductase
MTIISIIAAVSQNGIIGKDNKMPWHIKEDMELFKACTLNKPVIMGRKTHESIGQKLPGRLNIVISRDSYYKPLHHAVKVYTSLDEAIKAQTSYEEVFVIGGGQLYTEALPVASKIYLTRVLKTFEGDVSFPIIPMTEWNIVSTRLSNDSVLWYEFQILERK